MHHHLNIFTVYKSLNGKLVLRDYFLKSKYESDIKKVDINPSILESYLLDSLWQNLQTPVKIEETSSIVQNFQFHTPQPI